MSVDVSPSIDLFLRLYGDTSAAIFSADLAYRWLESQSCLFGEGSPEALKAKAEFDAAFARLEAMIKK